MTTKSHNYEKVADMVLVPGKHFFSDEELLQKSSEIAHLLSDIEHEEAEKKTMAAQFKNKIDVLKAEAKLISGHINNKFKFVDVPCELFLDYDTNTRVYMDKQSGEEIKHESFHASDYQKKIDFTGIAPETQAQIDENNQVSEFADPLDEVIQTKVKGGKKHKPDAEDFLVGDVLTRDRHGNLTDIPSDLPGDEIWEPETDLPTE